MTRDNGSWLHWHGKRWQAGFYKIRYGTWPFKFYRVSVRAITYYHFWRFYFGWKKPIGAYVPHPQQTHTDILGGRMQGLAKLREHRIANCGHDMLLRLHYLHGTTHPDDGYLPLTEWDNTP